MNKDLILLIAGGIVVFFILYELLIADAIGNRLKKSRTRKLTTDKFEKIAQIKLISDDSKEIEKFISDNTEFLSDETVKKLVERMEVIKSDRIINNDNLKARIETLASSQKEPPPEPVKRANGRK